MLTFGLGSYKVMDMNNTPNITKRRAIYMAAWAMIKSTPIRAWRDHLVANKGYDPADAFAECALIEVDEGHRIIGPELV